MTSTPVGIDTPKVSVTWDSDTRCVLVTWKGLFLSGNDYRDALMGILDLMEQKRGRSLLTDARNMPVMSPEDQQWLQKEFMPRSVKVGMLYSAIVLPRSALTKLTLRHIIEDAGEVPRQRAYFATVDEAKAWLKSVDKAH